MARSFNGSTDYVSAGGVVSAEPLTIATWFNAAAVNADYTAVSLGNNGQFGFWRLYISGSEYADKVIAQKQNDAGVTAVAQSTASFTAGTWHHGAAVFASDTSRTAYLDGVAGTENTTSTTDPTPDFTSIGVLRRSGLVHFFSGSLCESAVWSAALTGGEIAALADGYPPHLIRPSALVFYAPLVREVIDLKGLALTATGTTVSDHPRVIGGRRRSLTGRTAAGGGTTDTGALVTGKLVNRGILIGGRLVA